MASAHTALRMMREVCLSLPDTAEATHFGEVCFRVGKRMFATCGEKKGICRIVVQLEPEHARRVVASHPRFEPYARQKNCVQIDVGKVEDWDEVRALVLESYRLIEAGSRARQNSRKATRKKRARK